MVWENPVVVAAALYLGINYKDLDKNENLAFLTGINALEIGRDSLTGEDYKKNMNFITKTLVDRFGVIGFSAISYFLNKEFAEILKKVRPYFNH